MVRSRLPQRKRYKNIKEKNVKHVRTPPGKQLQVGFFNTKNHQKRAELAINFIIAEQGKMLYYENIRKSTELNTNMRIFVYL